MKKFITETDLKELISNGSKEISFPVKVSFTPAALDFIKQYKLIINNGNPSNSKPENSKEIKVIALGADHTGFKMKNEVMEFLKSKGYEVIDTGTNSAEPCDYPDFAAKVARLVKSKKAHVGILFDATGNPSAITANKFRGIRAAVAINEYNIKSSREHNNSNILSIGARIFNTDFVKSLVELWLNTPFLGDRHQKRLDKITKIESERE